jgi:hypothetical protein
MGKIYKQKDYEFKLTVCFEQTEFCTFPTSQDYSFGGMKLPYHESYYHFHLVLMLRMRGVVLAFTHKYSRLCVYLIKQRDILSFPYIGDE